MPHSVDPQPSNPPSDYPELTLPEGGFKSNIPDYLLKDCEPQLRWLMEEMSKNTQATEWNGRAALDTNAHVRRTNGRLKGAEYHIIDLKTEIAALKLDNAELKTQMAAINPIVKAVSITKLVLSSKLAWFVLGCFVLFLLGYNRDVLPALAKALFGG